MDISLKPSTSKVSLVVWSILVVFCQLAFVRGFTTFNGAFAYYGNILLLVGMFSTSAGFFTRRAHRYNYLFPALLTAAYLLGLLLFQFNLLQTLTVEFQWTQVANLYAKPYDMELQLAFVLVLLAIIPPCVLIGASQKKVLLDSASGPAGYILMGVGGILGGLLFLLQNQYLSGHFSLMLMLLLLFFAGAWPMLTGKYVRLAAILPALVLLALAFFFTADHIWSPYQRVDLGQTKSGDVLTVYSNDMFILGVSTLPANQITADKRLDYSAPFYLVQPGDNVLVLGSGGGTADVREALYFGADKVTAVEIDPVFAQIGTTVDPDQTYQDSRVDLHIDDARHFLNQTGTRFDIIYGNYLDSQTNASNRARFRLDSFLYTKEGFERMYALLEDDGILIINFTTGTDWIRQRMFESMEAAVGVDNVRVFMLSGGLHRAFIVSKGRSLDTLPPHLVEITDELAAHRTGLVSSDDWPFLYSLKRVIPPEHLHLLFIVFLLLLVVFLLCIRGDSKDPAEASAPAYFLIYSFFSGAAFFFIELRAISVLTPLFGSTYLTQSLVISLIIACSILGSLLSLRVRITPAAAWTTLFLGLLVCGLAGWAFHPYHGNILANLYVFAIAIILPIGTAGIVFMAYLKSLASTAAVASMQRWNLIGGVLGGLAECVVILTGFSASSLIGASFYLLGFLAVAVYPRLGTPQNAKSSAA